MEQLLLSRQSESKLRTIETRKLAKRGLRVGRTSVGKGVFATRQIADGFCIGEIEGRVIADDAYVSRYSFDLNDGTQLEPDAPFRFVNHSCEPNCAFEAFSFPPVSNAASQVIGATTISKRKLLLFAICDIATGDELTIAYNWPVGFAIPCRCRTPDCCGWIVEPKGLAQLVQDQATTFSARTE